MKGIQQNLFELGPESPTRSTVHAIRWEAPRNSKARTDKAGAEFIALSDGNPAREATLEVINNWRAAHGYPLQTVKRTLLKRAKKIDKDALAAQRIKRLSSIAIKLRDNPNMRLSQMQDIAGCRAVMASVEDVDELVSIYAKVNAKNPNARDRAILISQDDYIKEPKTDGYRSVHLICRYHAKSEIGKPFNGLKVEIQIRSQLQHAWATAVETSQTFTGQALKSKVKTASVSWLRFFALMGSAIALRENRPLVPGTPTTQKALAAELRQLQEQERIIEQLDMWGGMIQYYDEEDAANENAHTFLLVLDPSKRALTVRSFKKSELTSAQAAYHKTEKVAESDPQVQVVLVSVDSIAALRRAYPNYYVDSSAFVDAIKTAIA